ncbi:MAG: VirB4 family type IV secretion/conjugal transfer ATPase [Anaplasmataceae bacterium]|nr:VirB4 family type IV secretion/conjugal transfer ATPase [Anaplasmataceae bacterium]
MLNLFKKVASEKFNILKNDLHQSYLLPYQHHFNDSTIITKDGWMFKVLKLGGYAFETADDDDLDINKKLRNQLFKSISSSHYGLYFHLIRQKNKQNSDSLLNMKIINFFADQLNVQWTKKKAKKAYFSNELYLTVVRKVENKTTDFFETLYKKYVNAKENAEEGEELRAIHTELEELTFRLKSSLRSYDVSLLTVHKTRYGMFSEPMNFLRKLVNPGIYTSKTMLPLCDMSRYLPNFRLIFKNRHIEVMTRSKTIYGGIIGIKEYPTTTFAGMFDAFLQIPYDIVISQSFQPINRQVAVAKMEMQQRKMINSEDKGTSQIIEISQAIDDAVSGHIGFGYHHLTVMCLENTLKGLENALSIVDAELNNKGFIPVREKMNMEPAFWAQMPCNFNFVVRKTTVNTLNLAGFSSLHNYPTGKPFDNHWGEAVTVFDTTSGTPFFFSFHVKDVGHTTIIGPTGAGKTVLMNFLCAQSAKFAPRIFFFDKDRGADIFIRALGGVYSIIEPRSKCGFNPLQMDDAPDNRTFLLEWLKLLVTSYDPKISSQDIKDLTSLVDGNYKLKKSDRILRNLVPFLGNGELRLRIDSWYDDGAYAGLFDNDTDDLNFDLSSFFGFEMAMLLKDTIALGPVLLYLFHRINSSLDGRNTMIVLDEAWALIDNPIFAPKIKDWLKVLRKLNAMVIFATQSVEDASKSGISDTLIQQTATQIFLPNLKATDVYKTAFMLSDREYLLIKNTDPSSRFFLIKQGLFAVIAKIDLGGMEDFINVLSSRSDSVILLDKIIAEVGKDPINWLPIFYEKVKNL